MIDLLAAIVFVVVLALFLWHKRKQVQIQKALFPILYVVMYRSTFGLVSMDRLAKRFPRLLRWSGYISIVLGFIGMALICAELVINTTKLFIGEAVPGVQPVLPIEAKGVFFVPFLYWIISIFLLAVVHEFAHGVLARAHNMPVKSSGFAFLCLLLPVVPAAFVEPDEKVVNRRPYRQQLSVFAAGPVSNFVFALLMLGVFMLASPLLSATFEAKGVEFSTVESDGPAFAAGLRGGDIITSLNGVEVRSVENMTKLLNSSAPGEMVTLQTSNESFTFALAPNPKNASKGYMGVQTRTNLVAKDEFVAKYGSWLPPVIKWISGLIFWLFMLNIGIGLFNLLPIGPLDGGRMFQLVCIKLFKKNGLRVWSAVSLLFIALILVNVFSGFIL